MVNLELYISENDAGFQNANSRITSSLRKVSRKKGNAKPRVTCNVKPDGGAGTETTLPNPGGWIKINPRQTGSPKVVYLLSESDSRASSGIDDLVKQLYRTIVANAASPQAPTHTLYECNVQATMFLRTLYSLCRDDDTEDDAIDLVYERMASFLANHELEDCDDVLELLDETKVTPAVIASVLTITAGAKSVLTERSGFYKRAREHLNGIRGSVATERLLVGLA